MKKFISLILAGVMALSLAACGSSPSETTDRENGSSSESTSVSDSSASSENESTPANSSESASTDTDTEKSNILVAYFSLAGEQYNVGVIEEGNTSVIAHMIAEQTGADLFAIEAETPYPTTHSALLDVSRQDRNDNARPAIAGTVDNMADYDVIFIGYPNWWGDMPMIVYNFLESYDFSGKTIVPFCTHEGRGLSGTERSIAGICGDSEVKDGLAVQGRVAQNSRDEAKQAVTEWLQNGGFIAE